MFTCGESENEGAQSCPILCNPMDYSLPGSSIHGIFQAGILEWVAISFSRASSWPRDGTHISYVSCIGRQVLYHWCYLGGLPCCLPNLSLGWEDPLVKGMATHSSILAWRIPQTEEPGGLQSMGLQRVGHDWVTNTHICGIETSENLHKYM